MPDMKKITSREFQKNFSGREHGGRIHSAFSRSRSSTNSKSRIYSCAAKPMARRHNALPRWIRLNFGGTTSTKVFSRCAAWIGMERSAWRFPGTVSLPAKVHLHGSCFIPHGPPLFLLQRGEILDKMTHFLFGQDLSEFFGHGRRAALAGLDVGFF